MEGDEIKEQLKDKMVKTLLDKIEENIEISRGKNSTYSDESLFVTMIWAGINRISIEEATEQLEELEYNVPSSDTVLYHLSNQPYEILEKGFQSVINSLIKKARYLFRKPVVLAIDFNLLEWYGEDLPFIIKSKPRKGTDKFIGFATVAIVEDGKRFTLRALPVTPFSNKKEIVRRLLSYAMKFIKVKVVLMDRGFYSGEIIQMLNNWIPFIIPAVNNDKVKRYKEMAKENGEIEYEMNNGTKYRLVVYDDGKNSHPFATNTLFLHPVSIRWIFKHLFILHVLCEKAPMIRDWGCKHGATFIGTFGSLGDARMIRRPTRIP